MSATQPESLRYIYTSASAAILNPNYYPLPSWILITRYMGGGGGYLLIAYLKFSNGFEIEATELMTSSVSHR